MAVNMDWMEKLFFKRELTDGEKALLGGMEVRQHQQSEKVIAQGGKLYILHAGELYIEVTKDDVSTYLMDVGEGNTVGEMTFLNGGQTNADVFAKKDCVVYVLTKQQFETIMREEPNLAYSIFQSILESASSVILDLDTRLFPFMNVVQEKFKAAPLFTKEARLLFP